MNDTFYILDEERALIPESVQEQWKHRLLRESFTAFETPDQLESLARSASYEKFPALQKKLTAYAMEVVNGKPGQMDFSDFPPEASDVFLRSIGASGISFLLHMYLRHPEVAQSKTVMEALAQMSRLRHDILKSNAGVPA